MTSLKGDWMYEARDVEILYEHVNDIEKQSNRRIAQALLEWEFIRNLIDEEDIEFATGNIEHRYDVGFRYLNGLPIVKDNETGFEYDFVGYKVTNDKDLPFTYLRKEYK